MKTITESVEGILRQSPHVAEALTEGIVNYSALARSLRPEIEEEHLKQFTQGAIIMALKRLTGVTPASTSKLRLPKLVRSITVRSHLVEYAYENSRTLQRVQEKLLALSEKADDAYVYFTRGTHDTAIIASEALEGDLVRLAVGERCLKKFCNLSAISIRFHPEITEIPGVYYPFFQALAWRGINFVQLLTGFAELTFLFHDKDVDRAFIVLKSLTSSC